MKNLINFFIKYSVFFLFLFLEIVSITMVSKSRDFHGSIFFSSSNAVVSSITQSGNHIVEYFSLRDANNSLSEENTTLRNKLVELQNKLTAITPTIEDSMHFSIPPEMEYKYIAAKVIGKSTNKLQNYITINKGSRDGIMVDMGVVASDGVVGIVKVVNDKFAVVIPLLNPKIQPSCKFTRSKYTGTLLWSGKDYRFSNLTNIARHVELALGDTLITSGLTSTFPEGIPVGYIEDFKIKESDAYYNIKVKLAVNFSTLTHVKVINYTNKKLQDDIEEKALE